MSGPLRDPFGTALAALRARATQGRFGLGQALVIQDLAEELGLSITPVREALACLAGEGLLERRRGKGYVFPDLRAPDILDLYEIQFGFARVALALSAERALSLRRRAIQLEPDCCMDQVIEVLVANADNEALSDAYARLRSRMSFLPRAEAKVPDWTATDGQQSLRALAHGDLAEVESLLHAHHRRRSARANEVAEALRRTWGICAS